MKCKKVQFLIANDEVKDNALAMEHLNECSECKVFMDFKEKFSDHTANLIHPEPPVHLVAETRMKLIWEPKRGSKRSNVPRLVWTVMVCFLVFLNFWFVFNPGIDHDAALHLQWLQWLAVFFVVQNFLMLLCAPVLLRIRRISVRFNNSEL